MRRYDVVIIGGGSAGLTCGLALARRGKRVVIFEQHTAPGGYVTSFTRKGFRFDGGAGCFASGGIIFPILRALGLEDAIRPVPIGFTVLLGGERVSLASPETVIDGLGRLYPGSRDDLSRYFRRLAPLVQMMDISTRLEPYTSGTAGILRLLAAMAARPAILATLLRERRKTSDDLLAETIRHPEIRHVVKSLGYPTMSPMMTAGMWGAMFADYWYPLGGMRTISDAVAGAYQAAGGELRLGARVEAITCGPGGRATGVRLAGGEVAAGESVISAADITWTYSALEGEAGTLAAFRKRLADGIPAETMFSTYLGVRTEPGEVERQTFGTTIFEDPGDITREPATVYLTSAVDPTAAPQGLASLTIHEMADYAHWARLAGPAGPDGLLTGPIGLEPGATAGTLTRGAPEPQRRPAAYREAKEATADRAIRAADRLLPGLAGRAVVHEAASPVTYERFTGNRCGSSVGWSWNPAHRPVTPPKGLVPGLAAVGHWTYALGGIPTALMTGYMVGRRL